MRASRAAAVVLIAGLFLIARTPAMPPPESGPEGTHPGNTAPGAPAPSAEAAAREVMARELAFSARAQEINARDAFIEFFAPEGVAFNPDPFPAREDFAKSPPWAVNLQWWPAEIGISADGRLAYSTGPVERRSDRAEPEPKGFGYFLSIWRKSDQGIWEVAADIGIGPLPHAEPREAPVVFRLPEPAPVTGERPSLIAVDRAMAARAKDGFRAALRGAAAPTYRLHLPRSLPLRGSASAESAVLDAPCRWEPLQEIVAGSGDFGATWGTGSGCYDAEGAAEHFGYLRVWRRNKDGDWRILAEVVNVRPPK